MSETKLYKKILLHLAIGIIFIMVPYIFTPDEFFVFPNFLNGWRDTLDFVSYLLILLFCYINYYLLLPKLFLKGKYFYYVLCGVGFFLLIILPPLLIETAMHHPPFLPEFGNKPPVFPMHPDKLIAPPAVHISNTLFLYLSGLFVTLFLRVNDRWKQVEKEKLNTEVAYLKSQVNPHFLFNTLNSIYALAVKEQAPKTASGMLQLSGMMRHALTEVSNATVPLEKEIAYINNYIELQKLRIDKQTELDCTIENTAGDYHIAPIILIPFIENAFKYGINPDEKSHIKIAIKVKDDALHLYVYNRIVSNYIGETTGVGIDNTQKRLALLYPGKHQLTITETAESYAVELLIHLV